MESNNFLADIGEINSYKYYGHFADDEDIYLSVRGYEHIFTNV